MLPNGDKMNPIVYWVLAMLFLVILFGWCKSLDKHHTPVNTGGASGGQALTRTLPPSR